MNGINGHDTHLAIQGGEPIRKDPWPTYDNGDVFIHRDDELAAYRALRRRLYFRYDQRDIEDTENGSLENKIRLYFGARHALACASGTAALTLSLLALDLPKESLVACPAFTFAATPSAIRLAGHQPLLVECDQDLHLDVEDLRNKLTPAVRAIIVVHMRGFGSDVESVCALAAERGIPVVEDAVPALGMRIHGKSAGTFGTFGAFSTQSDKSLNTGEGGFLVTDDTDAFARAVVYSGAYEGRVARHINEVDNPCFDLDYPIFGWRMDEIRAALAAAMLDRLDARLAAHRRNYLDVINYLRMLPDLRIRKPVAEDAFLGEALVFRLPACTGEQVAWFARALRAEGITARSIGDQNDRNIRAFWNWRFLVGQDEEGAKAQLPRSARYLTETIDIPLSANSTERERTQLITAITKVRSALPAAGDLVVSEARKD